MTRGGVELLVQGQRTERRDKPKILTNIATPPSSGPPFPLDSPRAFEKIVDARALADINMVDLVLDAYRYHIVGVGHGPERTVHQGLVEVEHEALPARVLGAHRRQNRLARRRGLRAALAVGTADLG